MAQAAGQCPNLFQFWDSPSPPNEVSVLMEGWENEPGFNYRRYDAPEAERYIAKHFDSRALKAFKSCAVPAMQADFFRYCALYMEGGAYVDADTEASGKLAAYISDCSRGMLMNRQKRVANDFLFVRNAKDPLYEKVIQQAIENIEGRISSNVWMVTGPGIMTHMHLNPEQEPWFDGFDFRPVDEVRNIVIFRQKMDYKLTEDDWRSNLADGAPSIFRDL